MVHITTFASRLVSGLSLGSLRVRIRIRIGVRIRIRIRIKLMTFIRSLKLASHRPGVTGRLYFEY